MTSIIGKLQLVKPSPDMVYYTFVHNNLYSGPRDAERFHDISRDGVINKVQYLLSVRLQIARMRVVQFWIRDVKVSSLISHLREHTSSKV